MLSVIIITHNRAEKLRRCLESIFAQQEAEYEVVVLVNGSQDGSADMVRCEFPRVMLLEEKENLGVAKGRNVAAAKARGDVLVFLDDDAYFAQGVSLKRINDYFSALNAPDALVFTVTDADGRPIKAYVPRLDKQVQAGDTPCACLLGGACAIKTDVFRTLGGFWERLSPYGFEDRELMFRFLAAGHRALSTRAVCVVHEKHEDVNYSTAAARVMLAHHGWVALRHLPWRYVFSYLLYGWPYFTAKAAQHGCMRAHLKSLVLFMRAVPAILRQRQPISSEVIEYCKVHSGRLRY